MITYKYSDYIKFYDCDTISAVLFANIVFSVVA